MNTKLLIGLGVILLLVVIFATLYFTGVFSTNGSVVSTSDDTSDAGSDTSSDAGSDTSSDAGSDTSSDAGSDTSSDAGSDTSSDAGSDTSSDAGSDADEDLIKSSIPQVFSKEGESCANTVCRSSDSKKSQKKVGSCPTGYKGIGCSGPDPKVCTDLDRHAGCVPE